MRLPWIAALIAGLALGLPALAQTPITGTSGPLGSSGAGAPSRAGPAPIVNTPASPGPKAGAVTPTKPGAEAASPTSSRRRMTFQQRFDEANTTHDGKLTLEQAREHMPSVARDFAAIDTSHHGSVTADEIRSYRKAKRAERKATKQAAAAKAK